MKTFKEMTVGEIVTQNIEYARVLQSHQIDFCCGGNVGLPEAVEKAGATLEKVLAELKSIENSQSSLAKALNFDAWSLDLVMDYLFKFQHNYIRTNGPIIQRLLDKVVKAHGDTDPHLREVQELFDGSMVDLESHLGKEEQVLFPLIRDLLNAKARGVTTLPQFHCGSVENPIRVMMQEHDGEGDRFRAISALTNSYAAPSHACNSYKLMLDELRQFEQNLHIHIHVENNILFPKGVELEESFSC